MSSLDEGWDAAEEITRSFDGRLDAEVMAQVCDPSLYRQRL